MASIRIGINSEFNLVDSKVGIGTTNPTELVDVRGQIYSDNSIGAGGISTVTTYQGFLDTKQIIKSSVSEGTVVAGSLSGEIIVEGEVTVSSGTTYTSGLSELTATNKFTLPGMSGSRPTEGATRFNENLGALEFYTGTEWRAVNSYVDMGTRGRGVMGGRYSAPTSHSTIGYITIATRGNEQDFGELTEITQYPANGNLSSSIRGLIMGGSGPAYKDVISYITIASKGNAIDFGNLTDARHYGGGMSSSTRAIVAGGYDGSADVNVIDYVEISTIGNAVDFGDTDVARRNGPGCASPTRGVFGGGLAPGATSDIQFLTIASKGNSIRFGELAMAVQGLSCGSNSVRGLFNGCSAPLTNTIQYVTIASTGNAIDFGDMTTGKRYGATPTSSTRAVFAGGGDPTGSVIDSVEIATAANAVDFGDMMDSLTGCGSISDSHGGLGGF